LLRLPTRLAIAALLLAAQSATAGPARIAIIIDDLGYNLESGQRALQLPGPVAYAILPETPRGPALANEANQQGKEILLHLPLQALSADLPDERGGLNLDMSRAALVQTFASSFKSVPHAIGVNNHRGSLLTMHPGHMSWLMQEIKSQGSLFFVDSFTTERSIALALARESGVPAVRRDVFLDPDKQPDTVVREFERLKRLARKRGMAVGIGHPYPATLDLLRRELPTLEQEGIELISISHYVELVNASPVAD
jgi:polysaccharide deacetylase 2 family uncharacterized protein YibQ